MKDHHVADLLALGDVGAAGQDHEPSEACVACAHAGVVSPSTRRMNSPTIIDRRMPITSNAVSPVSLGR